jgi:colanic acid biosynthesis glycosyl transferase WcaI
MNILAIAQYFPPDLGGAATRASNLVKGLSLNGCNVTVIAAFPHYPHGKIPRQYRWLPIKIERMEKIRVIRTYMPPIESKGFFRRILLMGFFAISALFALPWVGKIDAVWSQSWVPGLIYGKLKSVPVALNVDDLTIEDILRLKLIKENSIFYKTAFAIYRLFYVKGDAITAISAGYVETIEKRYCVERSKIHVIDIGVDLTVFKTNAVVAVDNKDKPFKVIYAGVLGIGYDFDQVFQAAKILEGKNIDVKFVLHGAGECLELIRHRIKELNLTNIKLSDKLFASREAVASLLNEADALILPLKDYGYPYLGIPSKLYEYQAVGKPIICCAAGQPKWFILNTNSGIVVRPGDNEGLAKAIVKLKENPTLAQTLGKNGRKYVESEASIQIIGLKMKSVFEEKETLPQVVAH